MATFRAVRRSLLAGAAAALIVAMVSGFWWTYAPRPAIKLTIQLRATTGTLGEVFYASEGQIHDAVRSVPFYIWPHGWSTSQIELPSLSGLARLRIDAGTEPGEITFRRVVATFEGREIVLVDGETTAPIVSTQSVVERVRTSRGVLFEATAPDPFVEFRVEPPVAPTAESRVLARSLARGCLAGLAVSLVTALLSILSRAGRLSALYQSTLRRTSASKSWARLPWLSLLIPPVAGLLWGKLHILPTVMIASLTASLATTFLAGLVAQRIVDGFRAAPEESRRAAPGLFQTFWLGQYLTFALAVGFGPLFAALTDLTGVHIPLRMWLPPAVLIAAAATRRLERRRGVLTRWPSAHGAPAAAVIGLVAYRGMYLHSIHAGPLGHDLQQHIYWAQHIADFGFLPIASRGSDLIEYYPKFFHVLAASWSSMGLTDIVGPYVKVLPCLQITLACGFFLELLLTFAAARLHRARASVMGAILSAFVAWHLSYGDGQQIYDGNDLSGTPRIAAGWALLGLPLLVLAARVGTFRDLRAWLVALVPVFACVCLGINPALVPIYFTYSVPVAGLLYLFTAARPFRAPTRAALRALALGFGTSLLLLCSNPFVWDKLARTPAGSKVAAWLGLRSVPAGIQLPGGNGPAPQLCDGPVLPCAERLAAELFSEAGASYLNALIDAQMPAFGPARFSHWYWAMFGAAMIALAWQVRRYPMYTLRSLPSAAKLWLAILAASALPTFMHPLLTSLLGKLAARKSEFFLLHGYYSVLHVHVGSWIRCFLPLSPWLLVPVTAHHARAAFLAFALALYAVVFALTAYSPPALINHRNARRPWTIDWPELRAIRRLNDFVPPHETVITPAAHVVLGASHILMAPEPVGIVASHLTTRLLFLIRLGSGVDFDWPDLNEAFCGLPQARLAMLRAVNARWVVIRDVKPTARELLDVDLWGCGVTLATLGAEYPPAFSERDLALYRISP